MSLFSFLKGEKPETSAGAAKERLQLLIATSRDVHSPSGSNLDPKLLYKIQAEIILIIEKYVKVDRKEVKLDVKQIGDNMDILEVSVPVIEEKASA